MDLTNKTDMEILAGVKLWVGKEREAASQVLRYLKEVEARKLYLNHASSLFEFCMKELRYSRHEAQARIDAMRLMKSVPEIDQDIDCGKLSLTVAAQAQSAFRKENVRRAESSETPLTEEEKKTVLEDLISSSTREADRKLASHFPGQAPPEKTKPLSADLTRVEFNAGQELLVKLDQLKARMGQTRWEDLFDKMADMALAQLDAPVRRSRGTQEKRARDQKRTRYVHKEVRRKVWAGWDQGCSYVLENGERCGCKQNLQMDHIQEFTQGGSNDRENLRLMCAAHNRARSDRRLQLVRRANERCQAFKDEALAAMTAASE